MASVGSDRVRMLLRHPTICILLTAIVSTTPSFGRGLRPEFVKEPRHLPHSHEGQEREHADHHTSVGVSNRVGPGAEAVALHRTSNRQNAAEPWNAVLRKSYDSGFNISFTDRDEALEIFEEGNLHLTTGHSSACARPDHLYYNLSLPDCGGCRGLRVRMDNVSATCSSSASISTGHLASKLYYGYGDFEILARTAHSAAGTAPPHNAFTCFSAYTDGHPGVHNEIALCWPGDDTGVLHVGHWYGKDGDHEYRTVLRLGFNASAAFHRYKFEWRRDSITYVIDDKVVHRDAGSTMPFENLSMRIILRPNNVPSMYEGSALLTARFASYVPESATKAARRGGEAIVLGDRL